MHIQLLMQDLTESEMQYALAFRSQVESMSAVQSIHSRRVNGLLVEHEACVAEFTRRREPTDPHAVMIDRCFDSWRAGRPLRNNYRKSNVKRSECFQERKREGRRGRH